MSHRSGLVVGVDGSPTSKAAVEWAAHDAAMRNVALTLIHVLPAPTSTTIRGIPMPLPPDYLDWREEEGRVILDDALKTARDAASPTGPIEIRTELRVGRSVPTLAEMSQSAELVVVGSHGRGAVGRRLLGSVSTGLLHHAHRPVAVIHDHGQPRPSQAPVVVGIDGSPASELATAIAFEEASQRAVELLALHAWSDTAMLGFRVPDWSTVRSDAERVLAEQLAGWQDRYPDVNVCREVVCDNPARQLVEHADAAQLLVVGSHGRGGFASMLLGSVSTDVAQTARIPVIVARQPA